MSSTVVKCKELLCWTDNEDELTKLQSTSVCPVIVKNRKLFYEVEVDEKKKLMSPEEILVHIYQKLYGRFFHQINSLKNKKQVGNKAICGSARYCYPSFKWSCG